MRYTLILIIVFFLGNCKEKKVKSKDSSNERTSNVEVLDSEILKESIKEDFKIFLSNFIKDSTFRYSRVDFPLKGFNSDAEKNMETYQWTKQDWEFYFEEDSKYQKNLDITSNISLNDSIATFRLYRESSGYDINYRFNLKTNKWYLKYYSYKNF